MKTVTHAQPKKPAENRTKVDIPIDMSGAKLPLEIDGHLTEREARFIEEFLFDFNGTKAAIRAGYSKRSAAAIATEIRAKPHIRRLIDAAASLRTEAKLHALGELLRAKNRLRK